MLEQQNIKRQSRFCVSYENLKIPEDDLFGENYTLNEEEIDIKDDIIRLGGEGRKKSSNENAKGFIEVKDDFNEAVGANVYCMNRDGNYSGTTGLSRKESM